MRKLLLAVVAAATGLVSTVVATQAEALPVAPTPAPPVTGIPQPCTSNTPWPADASISEIKEQLEANFGFRLAGRHWTQEYRPSIKILWETLDAVSCTDYLPTLQERAGGNVGINATSTSGWSWGDWSLSKTGYVSLDFEKFKGALDNDDEGRLVRLVIHELAHAWNSDRYEEPAYWKAFQRLQRQEGRFSDYAGSSVTETFADAVGYYVGRCALNNPYDSGEHDAYYEFVKREVFDGREFGPEPGTKPNCTVPKAGAKDPVGQDVESGPSAQGNSWVSPLVGD